MMYIRSFCIHVYLPAGTITFLSYTVGKLPEKLQESVVEQLLANLMLEQRQDSRSYHSLVACMSSW